MFLFGLSLGWYSGLSSLGAIATTGIACGMYGLNVGHELGHRRSRIGRYGALISWVLTLSSFSAEHTRGHHRHAGPQDPATASRTMGVHSASVAVEALSYVVYRSRARLSCMDSDAGYGSLYRSTLPQYRRLRLGLCCCCRYWTLGDCQLLRALRTSSKTTPKWKI